MLVLDVYKADYEPAWVPVDHLLKAMVRPCNDGKLRGYLVRRDLMSAARTQEPPALPDGREQEGSLKRLRSAVPLPCEAGRGGVRGQTPDLN